MWGDDRHMPPRLLNPWSLQMTWDNWFSVGIEKETLAVDSQRQDFIKWLGVRGVDGVCSEENLSLR